MLRPCTVPRSVAPRRSGLGPQVRDDEVDIDANHALAGQALTFDIEVVHVEKALSDGE